MKSYIKTLLFGRKVKGEKIDLTYGNKQRVKTVISEESAQFTNNQDDCHKINRWFNHIYSHK